MDASTDLLTEAPSLILIVGTLFLALAAYVARLKQQYTMITRVAAETARVNQIALDAAADAVAKIEGPVANVAIHTNNKLIDHAYPHAVSHATLMVGYPTARPSACASCLPRESASCRCGGGLSAR